MCGEKKKASVCMERFLNNKGYFFVQYLYGFLFLAMTIPVLSAMLFTIPDSMDYDTYSAEQFFTFMRDDIIKADTVQATEEMLVLKNNLLEHQSVASYEKYGNVIRRQKNGQGHEIYLRDVKELSFHLDQQLLTIKIQLENGVHYERSFQTYQL